MAETPESPTGHAAKALAGLDRDERIALLHQHVPAMAGLAPFRTGTEGLHGVAWLGPATVFPQAVGLGATGDPELLRRVGAAVGREVRAKHAADPYVSLNVWAPVVNPLRHPLWGRNEEGLSEDARMSGVLGGAFARGLRGEHPDVWLTVPTLKHFLGYSRETDRATTSAHLPERMLREQELPAYLVALESGAVGAVMLSYNQVNGAPAHVSPLIPALRADDPMLVVISDAYAPTNLHRSQGAYPDRPSAFAAMIRAGVDSVTDGDADPAPTALAIAAALEAGLLDEAEVDAAALRVLTLRERLGELDGTDPYGVTADELGKPEHVALAEEAVRKSVVLLDNDGALPLAADGPIAVLGPLADAVLADWYSGDPIDPVGLATALSERCDGVRTAQAGDRVTFRLGDAHVGVGAHGDIADALVTGAAAEFEVVDWGRGACTLRVVGGRFVTTGPDDSLVATAERVGGWVVQEAFTLHATGGEVALRHLGTGRWVAVEEGTGRLVLRAGSGSRFTMAVRSSAIGAAVQAAAGATAVVVVGNDPHIGGRETRDRSTLALPGPSVDLVRAVAEVARRTVLVVCSSYPYALGPLPDLVDAVVWTSHGGARLGPGLADVLLGAAEPYGRLPQTWPASDDDLPAITIDDYIAAGAGYQYSRVEPLYPLGHGLSYTTVEYLSAALDGRTVRVRVANTGERPVDELVQVYVTGDAPFPRRRLVGAARAPLAAGASAEVAVEVADWALRMWSADRFVVQPGVYQVLVGASAEDVRAVVPLVVEGDEPAPRTLATTTAASAADSVSGRLVPPGRASTTGLASVGPTTLVFRSVDLSTAHVLELTVRPHPGRRARVRVRAGADGARTTAATARLRDLPPRWSTTCVPLSGLPQVGDLEIRVTGADVASVRVATKN